METNSTAGLSFERASYEGKGAACANCKGSLGEQYWHWLGQAICEGCRGRFTQFAEASQSKKAFGRAVALGAAASLGCGVLYAVFVAVTKYQLALVTIGIAFVIAKVVRYCSAGIGGRRYQILAVILTYLASAMGYAPGVWKGIEASSERHKAVASATSTSSDGAATPHAGDAEHGKASAGAFVVALGAFLAITLAAPILAATEAPIGLLIIGFGLWEAWKLSRGVPLALDGPYRTAPVATGPPSA